MSDILAIDPSIRSLGYALFTDGQLVKNGTLSISKTPPTSARIEHALEQIATLCDEPPHCVVSEVPQVYNAAHSKGDNNDLIPLAQICGGLIGMWPRSVHIQYTPHEWIGNLPKSKTGSALASPRGSRVWERLSEHERTNLLNQHDAIDAVGIGLFFLGRFASKKVYSRG